MMLCENLICVMRRLTESGYEAYAVGGCVRDVLLGKEPVDFDIATNALPEQTKAAFADFKTIDTGIKHGTVTVMAYGVTAEVTTYRTDGTYSDCRHPDGVRFSKTLDEDLKRRDFTMNAVACNTDGEIVDLFGGTEDMKNGIIRCVGNADTRFTEDALRILRALRFSATLRFGIEDKTAKAVHVCAPLIENISAERIFAEIKIFTYRTHTFPYVSDDYVTTRQIQRVFRNDDTRAVFRSRGGKIFAVVFFTVHGKKTISVAHVVGVILDARYIFGHCADYFIIYSFKNFSAIHFYFLFSIFLHSIMP